jgi:hypothetical protein
MPSGVRLILTDQVGDILESLALVAQGKHWQYYEALAAVATAIGEPEVAEEIWRKAPVEVVNARY